MSEAEEKFLEVVRQVCSKPGLYVGRTDFRAVIDYLEGYGRALCEAGQLKSLPFGALLVLLEHKHGFSNVAWGWWRHYLHEKLTDTQALKDFPDFVREGMMISETHVEELTLHRPKNYVAPHSPHTAKYEWW